MAMASTDSPSGGGGDRDVFGSLPNARPQRRSARRDRSAAKVKPAATGPAEAAAKPRAAAKAKPAARAKAATAPKAKTAARAPAATPPRPSSPQIPPAGYATPRTDDDGVPRGADLVTTAVQAAGELAQIGLAAGGRALKSALERLPRP
jgi:hypothetical protein